MTQALYHKIGSLPFWTEEQIERRESFAALAASAIRRKLIAVNPAFRVFRVEGPCLTPRDHVSPAYGEDDLFITQVSKAGQPLVLRGETTASTYAMARASGERPPVCFWQMGKSFRTETNDGASAAKLRFNEFWQQEFQVIYRQDTKADYRAALIVQVQLLLRCDCRVVESDRLPAYSRSTLDIEVPFNGGWKEIASCSLRTDYADGLEVCEIAIGLDRVVLTGAF
jgi:glycyl-tRNA synthetase